MDIVGKSGINREVSEIKGKDYKESGRVIIDKSEQEYFDITESPNKIKQIFDGFRKSAYDCVYIQDPYFDYSFYKDTFDVKCL
jgi:hypothetical protein